MSLTTAFPFIAEGSEATPGLWNRMASQLSDNIGSINQGLIPPSVLSGSTWASIGLTANSSNSDYIRMVDSSGQRSTYILGSHVGGTADGLNIWDESGSTMLVSFSKQSIRFFQNIVGPVFDAGGALTSTLNAATFGTGADSKESRIQAAIVAASQQSMARVYVPASMLPYSASSVSFVYTVLMVREGGDVLRHDVRAYGASGDSVTNDTTAIQEAMNACNAIGGGTVYVAPGQYSITGVTFPGHNIALVGEGTHYAYSTAVRTGTILRARSGSTTSFINLVTNGTAVDRNGCRVANITIDGNLQTYNGINISGSNIVDNVFVRGCLEAGVRLRNWTNATHLVHCGLVDNFGYGLWAEGAATTPFSVGQSNINLNQLGGVLIEGGFVVSFEDCVIEGNGRAAVQISRPDSNTNLLGNMQFRSCWFEDSRTTAIYIRANTPSELSAPSNILFDNCNISASSQSFYVDVYCGKNVTFNACNFAGSGNTNAITCSNAAYRVAVIDSTASAMLSDGLSLTQVDAFIATGVRCYASDRARKSAVTVFSNSWVNYGAPYGDAAYWFDRDGNVHVHGAIKSGTMTAAAFTLPVGYRPSVSKDFPAESNGAHGLLRVASNGQVIPYTGSNADYQLHGMIFSTE